MSWVRKKKKYSMPRNMYDSARIEEEGRLVRKYGLKNMREVWKARAAVDKLREQAKQLITAGEEEQEKLFGKLREIGFKVEKVADILALEKEDWLSRRLQTIVYKKGLSSTIKQARQLITHGNITIDGKVVNIPSYIVKVDEEGKIKKTSKPKPKRKMESKEGGGKPGNKEEGKGEGKKGEGEETREKGKNEGEKEGNKEVNKGKEDGKEE